MKTLISILVLISGAVSVALFQSHADDHRTCSCAGAFCSCSATCLDIGEIPTCTCGTFTCICNCVPKDQALYDDGVLPSMNPVQEANSNRAEQYFRQMNTGPAVSIANDIKALRDAIKSQNKTAYFTHARTIEAAYLQLTPQVRNTYEDWAAQNLTK